MNVNSKERVYFCSRVSTLAQEKLGMVRAIEFTEKLKNALNVNPQEHTDVVMVAVMQAKGIPTKVSYSCKNFSFSDKTELKQIVQKCMVAGGVPSVQQSVIMSGVNEILG